MVSRRLLPFIVATGALLIGPAPPAAAATGGGGCQLQGTGFFSPGLGSTAQNFTYSFTGSLTSCQSSVAGTPATGSVEAGRPVSVAYAWTYTDSTGTHSGTATATYQEPVPTGNGGCASSTTAGTALATWADGTTTVVGYTTTGAAAAVALSGSVQPSMTDTLVSYTGPTQAPPASSYTVTTTRWAGDSAVGPLTFQPPDPTACTGAGVSTATISGAITLGSAQ